MSAREAPTNFLLAGGNRARPKRREAKRRTLQSCWDSVEVAAAKLDLDPQALRARCRRAARNESGETIARLGMGVVARKLGTSWRVFVPSAEKSESGF